MVLLLKGNPILSLNALNLFIGGGLALLFLSLSAAVIRLILTFLALLKFNVWRCG